MAKISGCGNHKFMPFPQEKLATPFKNSLKMSSLCSLIILWFIMKENTMKTMDDHNKGFKPRLLLDSLIYQLLVP